jgi:cyclophilin family peptidyl-prolyl cis-trans isomerase
MDFMIKQLLFTIAAFSLFVGSSCNQNPSTNSKTTAVKPEVKTGIKPVADAEIAVIEMEEPAYGTIKIELYSNVAPEMVKRFRELAQSGFYNGTTFHRVSSIVIQGGDPLSKDGDPANDGTGKADKPNVPAEFSDVPFERGVVGAARSSDPNSANSQFYITMQRYPAWDKNYTVFGKVIEGMNNADTIAGVPKNGEKPLEPVKIKSISFQPKQ